MDLKQLRLFVDVAELGSFAKASEVLDIAQPTLSRQVRALELELRASLFHRNGRGVLLTTEGARFVELARGVLHAADAAVQVLHDGDRRRRGKVVCGLTPSIAGVMLAELVRRFHKQLPGAQLVIADSWSVTQSDQLRGSRLDFAIAHRPPALPRDLVFETLSTEDICLLSADTIVRDDSIALSDLAGLPLALPSRLHTVRRELERVAAHAGVSLNIVLEGGPMEGLQQLVAEGSAHTIATRFALLSRRCPPNIRARRIRSPALTTEFCLATPPTDGMSPLQREAADIARQIFSELAASAPPAWALSKTANLNVPVS